MFFLFITLSHVFLSSACSNFIMEDNFGLSVRTEDTSPPKSTEDYDISLITSPSIQLNNVTTIPFVAFVAMKLGPHVTPLNASQGIKAGLNIAGLSCDEQSLSETTFPSFNPNKINIDAALLCKYCLQRFTNVSALHAHLLFDTVNFIQPKYDFNDFGHQHWILRDNKGETLVIEFIDGVMKLYRDSNDNGTTGYGVVTNSPPFPWQIKNMQFIDWKQRKYNNAYSVPSDWYPDSRFQRLAMVKRSMKNVAPTTLKEAVASAIHVANTVSVPPGTQMGKDMSDEADDHRTEFVVIYDHKNSVVYWRSVWNQNFARVSLNDLNLDVGDEQKTLLVKSASIPWFVDVVNLMK